MKRRALVVGLAVLVGAAAPPTTASAQTTDHERAEVHFEAARRHVQAGRCDLALEELRLSLDYEPTSVGARLNLGDCYRMLGRLPEAFRQYKEAEANALLRKDGRVEAARRSAAEVEEKLVRVIVREPEPVVAGLVVTVDGVSAGGRPWAIAVTPGAAHTVEAMSPDRRQWRARINGQPGEIVRLDVALGAGPSPSSSSSSPSSPPSPSPSPSPSGAAAAPSHGQRGGVAMWGLVASGVGLAGLATGAVFGALTSSSRSDLADAVNADPQCSGTYPQAQCEPGAEPRLRSIEDRAFTQSTISTVAFVAGAVVLAGGIITYVLASRSSSSPKAAAPASTAVRIRLGAGGALEGSF